MPNMRRSDMLFACSFLLSPWRWRLWRKGDAPHMVETRLASMLGVSYAKTFDSGRTSLFYALKALGVGESAEKAVGDEVMVQAYTCVVVINAIRWLGAIPVYVDVGKDLNMDPKDAEKKITPRTKAIIIQHTFGQPADLSALLGIAKKHGIKTIEDCAHALGGSYRGKPLGAHANISIFSFGSDKIISCVRGGAVATDDDMLTQKLDAFHARLPMPERLIIFRSLLQYPLFYAGKSLYGLGIGKIILWLAKCFYVTPRIISQAEKKGKQDIAYPTALPNALATLLLRQLDDLEKLNKHRQQIVAEYVTHLPTSVERQETTADSIFLRYALFVDDPKKIEAALRKRGVILGDWYDTPIAPKDIDMTMTGYRKGDCPHAEAYAKRSINLPTHGSINKKMAQYIVRQITRY